MKVILLDDVKKVGKKGEVVEVATGYGRNFLIRNNLAVIASSGSMDVLKGQKQEEADHQESLKQQALVDKEKIEKISLDFFLSVGKEGKLFGSVSSKQVASELNTRFKIKVDRRKFLDNGPYNHLGINNVDVELYKGVIATIKVHIKEKK
ncbi:MAG: 50S ribosomal protein L9 [Erysipelothrix sp.]|nr:50S ribosomal protein L9 [Erysipelothrix sp.]